MDGGDVTRLLGIIYHFKFIEWKAFVRCGQPIENIYEFTGVYTELQDGKPVKEALNLEHVMWANTVLANGFVWGLVVHCGNETRMAMNGRTPKIKLGILDDEVNFMGLFLFLLMAILSAIVTAFSGFPLGPDLLTMYMRYLILLSNIIPVKIGNI